MTNLKRTSTGIALALAAACVVAVFAADPQVSLLIIGDIQVHTRRPDPTTAFVHLQDTLKRADVVYANLEGVLVKSQGPDVDIPDKKGWTHPGPGGIGALKVGGIPVVGLANNVAYGRTNILETARLLDEAGIAHTGAGRNLDEAHKPAIVERKGVKIGFLQYTARWYRENEQLATATEPGVARLTSRDGLTVDTADLDRVRSDIRRLRTQVDIVVVSHHNRDGATPVQFGRATDRPRSGDTAPRLAGARSGPADRTKAEEYQKQFARVALDTGADLVFGHGTHTVQGVEVYNSKPIFYAIGHSAFDQPGYENSKDGMVIRATIQGKKLVRVSFTPVSRDEKNDVMLVDPSTGEGAKLVQAVKDRSGNVTLKIDGQEVVLIDKPVQLSTK